MTMIPVPPAELPLDFKVQGQLNSLTLTHFQVRGAAINKLTISLAAAMREGCQCGRD